MRDVLFALDSLDKTALAENLVYDQMKTRARQMVLANPKPVREQVVLRGKKPLEIALNMITNLCGADIASGADHVYRGKLGMQGVSKRGLFGKAQKMRLECGFIEQEDYDCGLKQLAEEIKQVG